MGGYFAHRCLVASGRQELMLYRGAPGPDSISIKAPVDPSYFPLPAALDKQKQRPNGCR